MKRVTVIIPMYNAEKYLAECLSSVDTKLADVICINDGSTDKTIEIAKKFPVKIVNNNFNIGQGLCRNIGLAATETEYTMFLDSDDTYSKYMIPAMLQAVQGNEYAVCGTRTFGDFYREYGSLRISGHRVLDQDTSLLTPVVCWNKIYRTDTIKGKYLRFPYYIPEDNAFWFCYTCANLYAGGCYVPEPLYNYRIVDNGSFAKQNKRINPRYDTIAVFFCMYDYLVFIGKFGLIPFLFESYFANFLRHYKHITGASNEQILKRVSELIIERGMNRDEFKEDYPEVYKDISRILDKSYII